MVRQFAEILKPSTDTIPKFSITPEKLPKANRKGSSSNHHFPGENWLSNFREGMASSIGAPVSYSNRLTPRVNTNEMLAYSVEAFLVLELVPWAPKTMKNEGFGQLKTRLCTFIYHKNLKTCKFWGPMVSKCICWKTQRNFHLHTLRYDRIWMSQSIAWI